jgi:anti-sigma regulatory factor (Ser/Thr protein kinase)
MAAQEKSGSCERRLLLSNNLSELDRLGAFARDIGRDDGLDEDRVFALQLCLEEAVANIITHGGAQEGSNKHIWVTIAQAAHRLVACLEDDGFPFDPTTVAPAQHPTSLEDARVGGLGVHLIRKLTTDVRYERVEGRNRLTLEFGPDAEMPA